MTRNYQSNTVPETDRRSGFSLDAQQQFRGAVHVRVCVPSGGRSANRSAKLDCPAS
jgi:hypothetical protein